MRRLLYIAAIAGLTACSTGDEPSATPEGTLRIEPGSWRLSFDTPLGELPLNLELSQQDERWTAVFVNGAERLQAEVTTVDGPSVTIEFPSYNSRLTAELVSEGSLEGNVRLNRSDGPDDIPFIAQYGPTHRFFPTEQAEVDTIAGRWALTTVAQPDGEAQTGLLELEQQGARITGTSMKTTGDSRFLTGELRGQELYLSTFTGSSATLWRGTLAADGTLSGRSHIIGLPNLTDWTARPDANAELADPTQLTYLKEGYERLEFSFPDLDGKTVSLSDEQFQGKVVVVVIGGSWCPTCHDETAFFSPYFNANRERGLEAIGLMYEYSEDFELAATACRKFKNRYDVQYPMLIAGISDKEEASKTLPMINAVLVYPTMIFIDRKGTVRHIHTGFPGPATGEHHEAFKRDFTQRMDALLAEEA